MKIILQDNQKFILRFDKDEDVIAGLEQFMADQKVSACSFDGIGSCSSIELGYFNKNLKAYRQKPYLEDFEIISFTGNGSINSGKPAMHAHGMFGRTDFTVLGGHVFKMVVSATCEIFLVALNGELKRENSPEVGLDLFA